MYSRGPCRQNEILVMPKTKAVPICERNNCEGERIKFNNVCTTIESHEACKQPAKDSKAQRLYVNPTTLQLYCTMFTHSRVTIEDTDGYYEGGNDCFLGGKRSQEGLCL